MSHQLLIFHLMNLSNSWSRPLNTFALKYLSEILHAQASSEYNCLGLIRISSCFFEFCFLSEFLRGGQSLERACLTQRNQAVGRLNQHQGKHLYAICSAFVRKRHHLQHHPISSLSRANMWPNFFLLHGSLDPWYSLSLSSQTSFSGLNLMTASQNIQCCAARYYEQYQIVLFPFYLEPPR